MRLSASGKIIEVKPYDDYVKIVIDTSPTVRAYIREKPWARYLAPGDLVTVHGTWLDGYSGPSAVAIRAHSVFLERNIDRKIAWKLIGAVDELVIRPSGAIVTLSYFTARGRRQLEATASREVVRTLREMADRELDLAGTIVQMDKTWRIEITTVQATQRKEEEEAHEYTGTAEAALR